MDADRGASTAVVAPVTDAVTPQPPTRAGGKRPSSRSSGSAKRAKVISGNSDSRGAAGQGPKARAEQRAPEAGVAHSGDPAGSADARVARGGDGKGHDASEPSSRPESRVRVSVEAPEAAGAGAPPGSVDEASAPHRTPGVEDAAGVGAGRGAGEQAAPVGEGESGRGVRDAGSARENGAAVGGTGRAGDSESPVGESGREGGSSGGWSTERPAEDRVSTKPRRDRVKNKISNRELAAMYEDLQRMGRVPAESRRKTRRADGDATAGASGAGEAAASLPERPSQQGRRGSAAEAPAPKMKDALPADLEVMRKSILASMEVEEKEGVRRTRRAVSTPSRLTYGSSGQAERKAQFMARVPQGPKRPKVGAEHQAPEVAYTCPVSERPPLSDAERRYVSRVVYTPPDPAAEAPPAAPAPTPSRRGGVADRPPMQLDDRMRPKLESRVVAATDNDRALHRKLGTSLAAHLGFKGLGYQVCRSWAEDEIDKFRAGYDEYSDDLRMLRRHHLSGRSLSDVVEFYWAVWLPGYHAHVRKVRNLPREQLRSNVEVDDDSEIEESEEKEKE